MYSIYAMVVVNARYLLHNHVHCLTLISKFIVAVANKAKTAIIRLMQISRTSGENYNK